MAEWQPMWQPRRHNQQFTFAIRLSHWAPLGGQIPSCHSQIMHGVCHPCKSLWECVSAITRMPPTLRGEYHPRSWDTRMAEWQPFPDNAWGLPSAQSVTGMCISHCSNTSNRDAAAGCLGSAPSHWRPEGVASHIIALGVRGASNAQNHHR